MLIYSYTNTSENWKKLITVYQYGNNVFCFLYCNTKNIKLYKCNRRVTEISRVDMELPYINTQLSANERSQFTNVIFLNILTVMSFKTIFPTNNGNMIKYSIKHNPKIS